MKFKSLHKAKHGFVIKMLLKGYTSSQICKLTGNSTPRLIDEVYSHIQAKDFRKQVKKDLEDVHKQYQIRTFEVCLNFQ